MTDPLKIDEEVLEYYSDPSGGGCVGCPLGEPFLSTAEVDIMMRKMEFVQAGIEFKRGARAMSDVADVGILPRDRAALFAAPPGVPRRLLYAIRATPRARRTANALVIDRSLAPFKILLMHHFACGLRNLHRAGYAHLNVSLANLLIATGLKDDHPAHRGFLGGLGVASASCRGGAILSCVARGVTAYRAPETFVEYNMLGDTYFEYDTKADVWALGIAFLSIVTGANVFAIGTRVGVEISLRGLERVNALKAELSVKNSRVSQKDVDRALAIECVRWQSYRNFGQLHFGASLEKVTADPELSATIQSDSIKRRVVIALKIGNAPFVQDEWKQTFVDLLTRMLHPCPELRATADEVVAHAAFRNTTGWSERWLGVSEPPRANPPDAYTGLVARGGWSANKDAAVVRTLMNVVSAEATKHLSAEALFVAHDIVSRVVAGVDAPEPMDLLSAAGSAAARVALLLFDVSTSLDLEVGLDGETSATRAYEPYVVEYLGGRLRRNNLFTTVTTRSDAVRAIALVTGTDSLAREFRAKYLSLVDLGPHALRPEFLSAGLAPPTASDAEYLERLKLVDVRQIMLQTEISRF